MGVNEELSEQRERKWRERCGLSSRLDDRQAGAVADHQTRGGTRASDRHADLQTAIGGRAPQLLGNRSCVAEEARQAMQIEHDLPEVAIVTARIHARGKLLRHCEQCLGRATLGSVYRTEHDVLP